MKQSNIDVLCQQILMYRLCYLLQNEPSDCSFSLFTAPTTNKMVCALSDPAPTPLRPIFTRSKKCGNSPTKATKSTTSEHYRLWQEIRDPNQDRNRLPKTHIFSCNMKPSSERRCFIFLPLLSPPGLLMWNSTKGKAVVSQKIFWRPWQNGWVSITVMRLQEWPPRFPHLRHLSPRLLQGIHSFLYNSPLSLLLLPLSFALCSHSLFTIPEIYKRWVRLCARAREKCTTWQA